MHFYKGLLVSRWPVCWNFIGLYTHYTAHAHRYTRVCVGSSGWCLFHHLKKETIEKKLLQTQHREHREKVMGAEQKKFIAMRPISSSSVGLMAAFVMCACESFVFFWSFFFLFRFSTKKEKNHHSFSVQIKYLVSSIKIRIFLFYYWSSIHKRLGLKQIISLKPKSWTSFLIRWWSGWATCRLCWVGSFIHSTREGEDRESWTECI